MDFNIPDNNGKASDKEYNVLGSGRNLPLPAKDFQIPLNTLFTQIFGIAGPLIRRYRVPIEQKSGKNVGLYDLGQVERTDIRPDELRSSLGTPVQFWMKFNKGEYNIREKGEIVKKQRDDLYLPWTSVATFSRAKRWTTTYMSGQEDDIIEEYGFEAWDIRIQGLILKDGDRTIEKQIEELQLFENLSDSISVSGHLFQWLKIDRIAFGKITYPEARHLNMESVKPYEIHARSVRPVQLILD